MPYYTHDVIYYGNVRRKDPHVQLIYLSRSHVFFLKVAFRVAGAVVPKQLI